MVEEGLLVGNELQRGMTDELERIDTFLLLQFQVLLLFFRFLAHRGTTQRCAALTHSITNC